MQRLMSTIALAGWLFCWAVHAQEAPEAEAGTDAAARIVAELHDALVAAATLAAPGQRYDALLPIVRRTHDLPFIAEVTIRRQWRELDEQKRAAFVAAFERLSVATYASRFAGVGPDTFGISGATLIGEGRVEVSAYIARPDDDDVPLTYVLQQSQEGGWRIVNILADGVSDLAMKRAEYQRVFRDGGTIDDLIDRLDAEAAGV